MAVSSSSSSLPALVRTSPSAVAATPETRVYRLGRTREELAALLYERGIEVRRRPGPARGFLTSRGAHGIFAEPTDDGYVLWCADRGRLVPARAVELEVSASETGLRVGVSLAPTRGDLATPASEART